MTVIQQVLFELKGSYLGYPYFVTGNALFNAVARRVGAVTRRSLHVSHGVFLPGEYGEFPVAHSRTGYAGKLGTSLPAVESYADLFVFRDAAHRWLLESRPRDAHNALPLELHGDRVAVSDTCWFGCAPGQRNRRRSVSWFVHCYLHGESGVVPVGEDVLDGLQVGGARNYGFGEVSVADTQLVDLDEVDYSEVREAAGLQLELVSPYVLSSECPGADSQSVPWWWGVSAGGVRRRETRFVTGDDVHRVETVDHGQVVEYVGDDVVRTAKNGVLRVGTHSRFGFGEFRLRPVSEDRVPGRSTVTEGGVV